MNRLIRISSLWLLLLSTKESLAQASMRYRFEAEVGVGTLQLPSPYRPGWLVRQQVTAFASPRVGVALGLHWGASANLAPLRTIDPKGPTDYSQFPNPDPARLREFYQRNETMTNVSVVLVPVLSGRHRLKIQAGLSAYKRREIGIDSIVYFGLGDGYSEQIPRITNTMRLLPTAAVGYDLRLSNHWSVGAQTTGWFTGDGRPTTSVGLHGTYRFGLRADSLGLRPVDWQELRYGSRAGVSIVASNGRSAVEVYRARFNGGLWAELPLSLTWAMRGEVNYAQRGYRQRDQSTSTGRYVPTLGNLNYLEIPLLFRHEVAYHWYLYGGPYLAFFLNGSSETDGQRDPAIRPHTVSGLMLGTTYALTDRLAADLRYQRDLVTFSSTPYGGFHSFQAGLIYTIGKKP